MTGKTDNEDNKAVNDGSLPGQDKVIRAKRGRPPKSINDWGVIDGGFAALKRPNPPEDLTETQQKIWRGIVSSEPPDFFVTQAQRDMLKDLVCHRDSILGLTETINSFRTEWLRSEEGAKRYDYLLKMRGRETHFAATIATKLRLTKQSRYMPEAAARAERNNAKVRPWEEPEK